MKKHLAAKAAEADSLSRRVGAVNSLTTAFEQVGASRDLKSSSFSPQGLSRNRTRTFWPTSIGAQHTRTRTRTRCHNAHARPQAGA